MKTIPTMTNVSGRQSTNLWTLLMITFWMEVSNRILSRKETEPGKLREICVELDVIPLCHVRCNTGV